MADGTHIDLGHAMITMVEPTRDPERLRENDSYVLLEKNLEKIRGKLRIQIACGTKDDTHLTTVREFHQALVKHGVDHTYIEIEGLNHNPKHMIAGFRPIWFDYHVESLRQAAAAIAP